MCHYDRFCSSSQDPRWKHYPFLTQYGICMKDDCLNVISAIDLDYYKLIHVL